MVLAACWPVRIPNVLAAASQGMAGNLYDWGGDGTGKHSTLS
ncbi:MAG: hypothetical protein ACP5OR_08790 [Candidatus Dormibacteria bacterium]